MLPEQLFHSPRTSTRLRPVYLVRHHIQDSANPELQSSRDGQYVQGLRALALKQQLLPRPVEPDPEALGALKLLRFPKMDPREGKESWSYSLVQRGLPVDVEQEGQLLSAQARTSGYSRDRMWQNHQIECRGGLGRFWRKRHSWISRMPSDLSCRVSRGYFHDGIILLQQPESFSFVLLLQIMPIGFLDLTEITRKRIKRSEFSWLKSNDTIMKMVD